MNRAGAAAGVALSIAGLQLAAAHGDSTIALAAYALAAALGGIASRQGDRRLVRGSMIGTLVIGYAAGTVLSTAVTAGLLAWLPSLPVDFAVWRAGLQLWPSWAGVGAAVLVSFFVVGLLATFR